MQDDDDLRAAVNKKLSTPLSDAEWELLDDEGYTEDWKLVGGRTVSEMADVTRERRKVYGSAIRSRAATPKQPRETEATTVRQRAISFALWLLAQQDPEVEEFRSKVLRGKLIPDGSTSEEVERRLQQAEKRDREEHAGSIDEAIQVGRVAAGSLNNAGNGYVSIEVVVQMNLKTALNATQWLLDFATRLSKEYGWSGEQAGWFIVNNACPAVAEVLIETEIHEYRIASRLVLRIDPTTPPEKVAAVYREARQRMVGAETRSQSDKQALLAFSTWRSSGARPPWKRLHKEWNELVFDHPEWQYPHESNFRRDALEAQQRLFDPIYGEVLDDRASDYLVTDPTTSTEG